MVCVQSVVFFAFAAVVAAAAVATATAVAVAAVVIVSAGIAYFLLDALITNTLNLNNKLFGWRLI